MDKLDLYFNGQLAVDQTGHWVGSASNHFGDIKRQASLLLAWRIRSALRDPLFGAMGTV